VAGRRQRAGGDSRTGRRPRTSDSDRTDSLAAFRAVWPIWLGGKNAQKFEILRCLFWDNQKLSGYMATYRYLRAFTPNPDPQVLAFLRKRIDDYLSILDRRLQRSIVVVGDAPTVADISLTAYLHYPSEETGYIFF
jgi:glutathione S-transferase